MKEKQKQHLRDAEEEALLLRQEVARREEGRANTSLRSSPALLLPLRQQSSLRGCARAPQKASADNPLAGSAEWDPDTVTPAETNLGVKLTGQVGAKPQRWLLRLLRSSAWR